MQYNYFYFCNSFVESINIKHYTNNNQTLYKFNEGLRRLKIWTLTPIQLHEKSKKQPAAALLPTEQNSRTAERSKSIWAVKAEVDSSALYWVVVKQHHYYYKGIELMLLQYTRLPVMQSVIR